MAHPAFRKFNKKETSQIAKISESLLLPRPIQAQLFSQRESDRPLILQDIYNQAKKIKQDKLQGRNPIDSLIDTLKEEIFVWSSKRDSEGHITSLFLIHPLAIKLLHGFPHLILMDCTYKTNKYQIPLFHIFGFRSSNKIFSWDFCLMKNKTETSSTWELNQYIEQVLNNTNLGPPPVNVIDRDLALKNSLKKLFPDSKFMLCIWHIKKDVSAHFMKTIGHGTDFENFMGLWNQVMYLSTEKCSKDDWEKMQKQVKKTLSSCNIWKITGFLLRSIMCHPGPTTISTWVWAPPPELKVPMPCLSFGSKLPLVLSWRYSGLSASLLENNLLNLFPSDGL
ncbi:hypothetical protein O181_070915 [Austropuccinia psidii MF-1]|uniref:MULE transposase domain-containing protein n=1 Tax=Austropuccinia psidii MF-1 TaxID=1389203 RepID=A0A9Q3F5S6_9BASI|nr:hypothetical protein [Austropuccinia psidii MF-1]